MNEKFKNILEKQLQLAKTLSLKPTRMLRMKDSYEAQSEMSLNGHACSVTKHTTYDSVFFIAQTPNKGWRSVKFYHDLSDYRIGAYWPSAAEAYTDALCYM